MEQVYSLDTSPSVKGQTNGYSKLGVDAEVRFPFTPKSTLIVGAAAHFLFEDSLDETDISFSDFGFGAKYILGGNILNPRFDTRPFPGLDQQELVVSQYVNLALGAQVEVLRKIFVTPHVHMASVGFGSFKDYAGNFFNLDGEWKNSAEASYLMSAGSTFSYNSLLGPINLDVSWVNGTNNLRVFVGIGFNFNKS